MAFGQTHSDNTVQARWQRWLRDEFSRESLVGSLSAGFIIYILEAIVIISFTALIFQGDITEYLSLALTFFLIGDAIILLIVSLLSSYQGSIAIQQDTPAVILAAAVALLVSVMPSTASGAEVFSTILVLILTVTFLIGIAYILLGVFKLGGLVRFLPYPVMGGFLAGTGWLLFIGGIGAMLPDHAHGEMFRTEVLLFWLPGLIGGTAAYLANRKWPHSLTLIISMLSMLGIFYLFVLALQIPFEDVSNGGWLLGPFPENESWTLPLTQERFGSVHWPSYIFALPSALPALVVGVLALLLNASSLELVIKNDLDINKELVAAGLGNLLGALGGGLVGYHAISFSILNHNISKGKRLPGLIVAALIILTVLFGMKFLSFVPRMVLGALLVFLGLDLMYEWIIEVWKKFPKVDAALVMTILLVIILKGFLWGIGVGMVLTIILFIVNYSRVDVIRYSTSGSSYRSRRTYDVSDATVLSLHADRVHIVKLDGFIFFGTANNLYEKIKMVLRREGGLPLQFIILDFALVSGLDSTALLSFQKMLQLSASNGVQLILSGLQGRALDQFQKDGLINQNEDLHIMQDLDRAIEFCETRIIRENSSVFPRKRNLKNYFLKIVPNEKAVEDLISYMRLRTFEPGEYLMRAGDPPTELYFIESGQVTIQLDAGSDVPVRLETTGGGRVIGELGFYLSRPRTADVIADEATVAYVFCQDDLDKVKKENAEAMHVLSQLVIYQTSERIVTMTRELDAMRR